MNDCDNFIFSCQITIGTINCLRIAQPWPRYLIPSFIVYLSYCGTQTNVHTVRLFALIRVSSSVYTGNFREIV
jgi:hypothetical protein